MSQLRPPEGVDLSDQVTIVPANEATWDDLRAILGTCDAAYCQCQRYKMELGEWNSLLVSGAHGAPPRADQLRSPERSSDTRARRLPRRRAGRLVLGRTPTYARLRRTPVPWKGRDEDPDDDGVWSVICFVTRAGFRRRGVSRALARATIDFARGRGARALEGYPMITEPGKEVTWGELNVGSRSIFADGRRVSHPTLRRVVMRIDFEPTQSGGGAARCRSVDLDVDPRRVIG